MATKNIDARFRVKKDTAANWEQHNPVLLDGEQIFVITAAGETRVKVGDGTKTYTQLPFTDEPLRTLIGNKVNSSDISIITNTEIDEICGAEIYGANEEVTY